MKTFHYAHRNSSAVITLSAEDSKEAYKELLSIINQDTKGRWRLECVEDEDE